MHGFAWLHFLAAASHIASKSASEVPLFFQRQLVGQYKKDCAEKGETLKPICKQRSMQRFGQWSKLNEGIILFESP